MKRTGLYLPEEVFVCWRLYAKCRGAHMSRNNALEELTYYLFYPDLLSVPVSVVEEAIAKTQDELRQQDLGKRVRDGEW